jgi:peptidoglycan/LPS O-acetylase OafA/YrhL
VALPITVYHLPFTVLGAPDADVAVWRLPVLRLPEFLFGCALCQCHLRYPSAFRGHTGKILLLLIGALMLIFVVPALQPIPGLLVPLWGALILSLTTARGPIAKMLAGPTAVSLGEASYALYLVHFPAWDWFSRLAGIPYSSRAVLTDWPLAVLYVLVCIALSMLIVRWVERPMRHHLRELLCSPSQARGRESMTSA